MLLGFVGTVPIIEEIEQTFKILEWEMDYWLANYKNEKFESDKKVYSEGVMTQLQVWKETIIRLVKSKIVSKEQESTIKKIFKSLTDKLQEFV